MFKNGSFKSRFDNAKANAARKTSDQIKKAKSEAQAVPDEFTKILNATDHQFNEAVATNRQAHAGSPEMLQYIDGVVTQRASLLDAWYYRVHLKGNMTRLVNKIRSTLSSP
ncbi:hypothetical protein [Pseudomonas cannabina]|nr:hypothetical protein [Pseudomonas cannabina]KAA8718937.1 hypothetical protein F4W70_01405 [Pseudomonas cannabina]